MHRFVVWLFFVLALALGCRASGEGASGEAKPASAASNGLALPSPAQFAEDHPSFETYWYQGMAELSRYELRQARYGNEYRGEAVLVFVTEDFLPKLQVKQEHGDSPDAISILKVNSYRRFYTGIYPYTLMTSSYTPVRPAGSATLKLSGTVQEWCGQVYSQINRRDDGLHAILHSYFQDDADQKMILPEAPMEDGIWAQIRIDPSAIPTGEQEMVPGLHYIRLRHKALRAYPVEVIRKPSVETELLDRRVAALELRYPALGRTLTIYYDPQFPHTIEAWEENVGPHRTTAVRTHAILDDYWHHNGPDDAAYRDALGLQY
ncbi:MAG: hypothetical protein PVH21_04065 [Myxococcales bacterium]|jgi:hypothetical protein